MDYSKFPKPQNDGKADHLLNKFLPDISLKNQEGNLLKIKRSDTFRLILYFYPMTVIQMKVYLKIGIKLQALLAVLWRPVVLEIIMKN